MVDQFVGRVAELEAIARAIDGARSGQTSVVLVRGDPGQGKSRLLEEATTALIGQRLWVRGYEPERNVPLAAASDLLGSLRSDGGGAALDDLLSGARSGGRDSLEPFRLFETVHLGLRNRSPALVLVDDVQWLDELSLALVNYLLRAAATSGEAHAFVVAGRPCRQLGELTDATRSLPAECVASIDLGPLDLADGLSLVRSLAPDTDPRRAAEIHGLAAGYPFWIRTLVAQDPGAAGGLTRHRLQGVTTDGARLAALLTVLGHPSTADELAPVLGWTDGRLATALAELAARAIVVDRAGSINLAHDLVRAAAERELPDEILRTFHRRVADAIEAEAGEDVQRLRSALEHRRAGGLATLDLALRLARTTSRRWLGIAGLHELDEIAGQEDPARSRTPELWRAIASLATELGDHGLALDRWLLLADAPSDPRRRAAAFVEAARAAFALDLTAEAARYLTKARAAGPDAATSIRIDAATAELEIWTDRRSGLAGRHANQALAAARGLAAAAGGVGRLESEIRRAYVEALQPAYEAALQADDHEAIEQITDELLEVAGGFDEAAYLQAVVWSGLAARQLGRLEDAAARSGRALREAQQRVMPHAAVDAGRVLAATLFDLGRLAEAEAVAIGADTLAARVGDGDRVGRRMKFVLHQIRFSTGDWRAALEASSRAARDEPVPHYALAYHQVLATLQSRVSGAAAAAEVGARVGDARRLAADARCPRCAAEVELASAEAFVRIGQLADARDALRGLDAARPTPSPAMAFWRTWVDALLAITDDGQDRSPTLRSIDAVIDLARQNGRRMDEVWLLLDRARLGVADRRLAAASFREAAELADAIGARTELRLAELGLRGLGERTWRRGPAVDGDPRLGQLTARELEVARLVAAGASNPEIATALFLSRKTIERHVSNVLMKVGARNRTELAARLAEAGRSSDAGEETTGSDLPVTPD